MIIISETYTIDKVYITHTSPPPPFPNTHIPKKKMSKNYTHLL